MCIGLRPWQALARGGADLGVKCHRSLGSVRAFASNSGCDGGLGSFRRAATEALHGTIALGSRCADVLRRRSEWAGARLADLMRSATGRVGERTGPDQGTAGTVSGVGVGATGSGVGGGRGPADWVDRVGASVNVAMRWIGESATQGVAAAQRWLADGQRDGWHRLSTEAEPRVGASSEHSEHSEDDGVSRRLFTSATEAAALSEPALGLAPAPAADGTRGRASTTLSATLSDDFTESVAAIHAATSALCASTTPNRARRVGGTSGPPAANAPPSPMPGSRSVSAIRRSTVASPGPGFPPASSASELIALVPPPKGRARRTPSAARRNQASSSSSSTATPSRKLAI
jgi:hypothetical protein